jgi:hypothetical protein
MLFLQVLELGAGAIVFAHGLAPVRRGRRRDVARY